MKITAFIKRNRVKLLMGLIVLCTALGAAFIGTAGTDRQTASAEETTTISGYYVFNNTISKPSAYTKENIDVYINGVQYNSIVVALQPAIAVKKAEEPQIYLYTLSTGWYDDSYREMYFGSSPVTVSTTFYNWLIANATKQTTALISGSWTWKEINPDFTEFPNPNMNFFITNVEFTSNNTTFNSFDFKATSKKIYYCTSTGGLGQIITVYSADEGWNKAYLTIEFEPNTSISYQTYNILLQYATKDENQTEEPEEEPDVPVTEPEPDDETKVITPSWYEFNDTITLPDSTLTEEIDFIANNMTFSMITIDGSQIKYGEHGTIAYNPAWGGWMNGMQPEILIQSNQYVSNEFYEWFQANLTMLNGYDSYLEGYNQGYEQGKADGYEEGKTQGYNQGYFEGAADAGDYSFLNLLTAVVDAPVTVFVKLLDFEILGWNMTTVVISLLSVALIVTLIAYFSGKK